MMNLLCHKVIYFRPNSSRNFKMAAMKTLFDHLIVPINPNAMMTTYVSSSYSLGEPFVVLCYVLIHISTNVSTLSTASGTIQPCFATGTAQSVTSHHAVTSHYFQQRFWSNIHVTLHGQHPCHIARAAVYPLLLSSQYSVDADVEQALIPPSILVPEGKHGGCGT